MSKETIYRKVAVSERMPSVEGIYFVGWDKGMIRVRQYKLGSFIDPSVLYPEPDYWLEKVELPSEDEITQHYLSHKGHINNPALFGANYILRKIKGNG